ncbi:hypothetical protein RR46_08973 [Papilio xuthus]|uniref:Uncharacterized protein n=1 Tax=Papilio xuthus TaxID=66420 RepID=A0A194PRY6_PAPXU|nr:hypothetical protein RR46_08973 [Papilio xuthus]
MLAARGSHRPDDVSARREPHYPPCLGRCHIRLRNKFACDVAAVCAQAVDEVWDARAGSAGGQECAQRGNGADCGRQGVAGSPPQTGRRSAALVPRAPPPHLVHPLRPLAPAPRCRNAHQQVISAPRAPCTKSSTDTGRRGG